MGTASISHLTAEDNARLAEVDDWYVTPFDGGYFLRVSWQFPPGSDEGDSDLDDEYADAGLSAQFHALRSLAARQGYEFLRLHQYGPVIEGLPTFDW